MQSMDKSSIVPGVVPPRHVSSSPPRPSILTAPQNRWRSSTILLPWAILDRVDGSGDSSELVHPEDGRHALDGGAQIPRRSCASREEYRSLPRIPRPHVGEIWQFLRPNPRAWHVRLTIATLTRLKDIDLAWHTHQLNATAYQYVPGRTLRTVSDCFHRKDTLRLMGRTPDHDDKIEENTLSKAFDMTAQAWRVLKRPQCAALGLTTSAGALRRAVLAMRLRR